MAGFWGKTCENSWARCAMYIFFIKGQMQVIQSTIKAIFFLPFFLFFNKHSSPPPTFYSKI